jgi:biotin-dependent carboxylase-like uncharacterized protein
VIPGLHVEAPGLNTTVQDLGRAGYQCYGIPVGGALDRIALMAANVVVGNESDAAALECLYQGPTLRVIVHSTRVAAAGAGAVLEVRDRQGEVRLVPALESVRVLRDESVRVLLKGPSTSCYLALEGGLAVPPVFGSRSTYARAKLGGLHGRAIRIGDTLPLFFSNVEVRDELRLDNVDLNPSRHVRIMPGPQVGIFQPNALETLCGGHYLVSPAADRMAMRLIGSKLTHCMAPDIPTEGIVSGSIQVPGDGQPIVLLVECQTTGGYTKIATVISADLPSLGRMGPGHEICFSVCSIQEAASARKASAIAIGNWRRSLKPARRAPELISLHSCNLISGVVDAVNATSDCAPAVPGVDHSRTERSSDQV